MAIEFNFGGPNGFSFDADGLFPPGEAGPKGDTGDTGPSGQGVEFGYLTVFVHVIDNFCDCIQASDFTIHISGNHQSPDTFQGSELGTEVTLGFGSYHVTQDIPDNPNVDTHLTTTLSEDCSGVIHPDESKTCTITNRINP